MDEVKEAWRWCLLFDEAITDEDEIKETKELLKNEGEEVEDDAILCKGFIAWMSDVIEGNLADCDDAIIQVKDGEILKYTALGDFGPQCLEDYKDKVIAFISEDCEIEQTIGNWKLEDLINGINREEKRETKRILEGLKENENNDIKRHAIGLLDALNL